MVFVRVWILLLALMSQQARADNHETSVFQPQYDAICAVGVNRSAGCDAIRAREIVDAAAAPWRAIGRVNFAGTRGRHHCTGTLVADAVVLTAAHCVFNFADSRWIAPGNLTFVAGFQRGEFAGASRVVRYVVDPLVDTETRVFALPPTRDWALLVLEAPLGQEVGTLPLAPGSDTAAPVLAGYAGLRPQVLLVARDCGRTRVTGVPYLQLRCAAMRGDSGGPLLVENAGGWRVLGVFSSLLQTEDGIVGVGVPVARVRRALADLGGEP